MCQPDPSPTKTSGGSIIFRGDCKNIGIIRATVTDLAGKIGFSGDELTRIEMAVGEAVENILEHAYKQPSKEWKFQRDPEIRLKIRVEQNRLIIELNDHGQSFDFCRYQPPHSHDNVRNGRTSGYGIFIMREFMDEVQYNSSAETGNTLRLVKYLKKS
jgi:serine/threonine-protein kinase RsbW